MLRSVRVLLIAPHASYRTAPFLSAATKLGVDVLIASQGRHSIVAAYTDGLHIDLQNREAALATIVAASRRQPFAAVIGTDDDTTELAARAAQALGLKHNPPNATRLARRKDLARARLREAGVRVPAHRVLDLRAPLTPQVQGLSFPCVLKPTAMSASRGVIRADDQDALMYAIARIERLLATEARGDERHLVLVEEFIPGTEIAVEGLLSAGQLELLTIFDKPDPLDGPFFEETYYVTPTQLDAATRDAVCKEVAAACRAYGLTEGPVHAECRLNDRGVWVIEVAARTIGGLCGRLLRFGTGFGLEELVLCHALGRPIERQHAKGAAGVLMVPIRQGGILRRIEGVLAAERVPGVTEVSIQIREGYELTPLPEGASYLGFIFAHGPDVDAVESALRRAHACLNIVVAPLFKASLSPPATLSVSV